MRDNLEKKVTSIIKKIFPGEKKIQLHEPIVSKYEKVYVNRCIEKNEISAKGRFIKLLERKIKSYTKSKYVVLTNSGSSALLLSLKSLNLPQGSEIIFPNLNYIASINAATLLGFKPILCDIESNTLGVDFYKIKKFLDKETYKKKNKIYNKKTNNIISAIMPTHIFGHPCNMRELKSLNKRYNLKIVEDASEGLGSFFKEKHVGTFGDFGVLSFNGNKTITSGMGGALLTNNRKLYNISKHLGDNAKIVDFSIFKHDQLGFNFRLPNLNCAIGYAQFKNVNKILKLKKKIFKELSKEFNLIDNISLMNQPKNSSSNFWINTLILDKKAVMKKNVILKYLNKRNIFARPAWQLMSDSKLYKNSFKINNLKVSKEYYKKIISIPSITPKKYQIEEKNK